MNIELMDQIYEFEFQLTDTQGLWLKTDASVYTALEVIKTGLICGKQVSRIKLFAINGEEGSACFIYDVAAAKSGNQPWSVECQAG
jgi:hypothetical protein